MNTNDKCNYCGRNHADDKAGYRCRMYREIAGKLFTKSEQTDAIIPRCTSCRDIHVRYARYSLIIGFTVVFLPMTFCAFLFRWTLPALAVGAFSGFVLANLAGGILEDQYFARRVITQKYGIKCKKNMHESSEVRKHLRKQWSFRDPASSS